jgi:hypothetical protein
VKTDLNYVKAEMQISLTEMKADLTDAKNQTADQPNTLQLFTQYGQDAIKCLEVPKERFSPCRCKPSVLNQEEQDIL